MSVDFALTVLGFAAFFAGFVDSVVGGGGLIQIPALFAAYPAVSPASLFGTNKVASIVGTSSAAVQYARKIPLDWRVAGAGAVAALVGAWYGAKAVTLMPPIVLRPLVLALLVLVAVYTFMKKELGSLAEDRSCGPREYFIASLIGGGVGFYDGFFGPGTGSFLIILFIRFLGMDFLRASVTAKVINVATNLAAISYFAASVEILWRIGLVMASCNLAGALIGSRMALRHGVGFVRRMFLGVVVALIAKLSYDTFMA
jgi:uncharacterized membrane protein YfcA